jgi:hypothetical protein
LGYLCHCRPPAFLGQQQCTGRWHRPRREWHCEHARSARYISIIIVTISNNNNIIIHIAADNRTPFYSWLQLPDYCCYYPDFGVHNNDNNNDHLNKHDLVLWQQQQYNRTQPQLFPFAWFWFYPPSQVGL